MKDDERSEERDWAALFRRLLAIAQVERVGAFRGYEMIQGFHEMRSVLANADIVPSDEEAQRTVERLGIDVKAWAADVRERERVKAAAANEGASERERPNDEQLTAEERATLEKVMPKALRMIYARDARLSQFKKDAHFYVGKLDRVDELAATWAREGEPEDEGDPNDARESERLICGEHLMDILGGYRERVARTRREGWTLPTPEREAAERERDGGELLDEIASELQNMSASVERLRSRKREE